MQKWEYMDFWEPLDIDGAKTDDALRKMEISTYTAK